MTNLFVEEAVKICKEKLKSLPELFERLIISYEKSADGYNWKLDWLDDPVVKHYIRRNIKSPIKIYVSKNYIGFANPPLIHVIGFTEEGRLFINKLHVSEMSDFWLNKDCVFVCKLFYSGTKLYLTKDKRFRRIFGFEKFVKPNELIACEMSNTALGFRLQGDVIADLISLGIPRTYQSFKQLLRAELEKKLHKFVEYHVMDALYASLLEHGFSPTIVDSSDPEWPARYLEIRGITCEEVEKNVEAFLPVVEKYFKVMKMERAGIFFEMELFSESLGEFRLTFSTDNPFFDPKRVACSIFVVARRHALPPLAAKILDEFERLIADPPKPPEIPLWIGGHRLVLRNFIPRTFSFTPSIQPVFFEKRGMPISINPVWDWHRLGYGEGRGFRLVSLEGAEIHISHREHGSKTVRVEPYNILGLRTIDVEFDYISKRNRAVWDTLIEKHEVSKKQGPQTFLSHPSGCLCHE
jgi:hypothetical protein